MVITRSLTNRASADTATDIELGNCVTEIGRGAFSGYTNISDVELPVSLNRIGVGAFSGSSVITVDIPDSVTSIGDSAFTYCRSFTSCTIGSGVTNIGESAFASCSGLTNIILPDSLRTIGASAFINCKGFTSITIPSGVTSIDARAFESCGGLIRINVNATTPPILNTTYGVFESTNCPIYVSQSSYDDYMSASTWSRYYSRIVYDGIPYKALFETTSGMKSYIKCDTGTSVSASSVPYNITSTRFGNCIDEIASFNKASLGNVVIPSNVKRIGNGAFTSAYTESITFSEGLETIGNQAFYYLNNANKYYPEIDITLPSTLNTVGASAFTRAKISSLTLNGNSTLEFNGEQFKDYGSYTAPLKKITVKNIKSISGFGRMSALTSVSISNVDTIGDNAFNRCYALTNLSITSNKAMTIGSSAFTYCESLTSVTLPDSVTSIGTCAFSECSGLTSINIPANVTAISDKTFEYCESLSSITIPNTVTSVGASAFSNCSGLTSCTLPNTLTSLSDRLFDSCYGLTTVIIPNSVITIGNLTFANSGIKNISIPSSVVSIGNNTFSGCRSLTSVTMQRATPPTIGTNVFIYTTCIIYVPSGSYDLYVNAENWTAYADRIVETGVGYKAILIGGTTKVINCNDNTTLALSEIGSNSADTINIGNCVTAIGDSAFTSSNRIQTVSIPSGVTSIGSYAFANCTRLTSITVEAVDPPTLWSFALFNTNNCPIYVPAQSVQTYKAATNWSTYASRIQAIPNS